ncbi:BTB/POZ and TAZ domain-containing protein 2-like [Canna indica]|uniref:BTB/POZ and TAZ domain-containing protein 2-like n=1 Tax=Canna indica TaxID=4628 RepID=A0AAQ3Q3S5_9LILI|nr:BTB/POZ and TAZ domain-containing protein 2-like [Canna indica]
MGTSGDSNGFRRWHEAAGEEIIPSTDVRIVTSDGQSITAHSSVLASGSPVLERMLDRQCRSRNSERVIHILGVSHDAVLAFVRFLYSSSMTALASREAEEAMAAHGVALLALAHAYRVPWLKRGCEAGMAARLRAADVVDVLKVAALCDAPRLRHRCMKLVAKEFAAVQQSEGWRFVQKHDPGLELEILQFLEEEEQRARRWRRGQANQQTYQMLNEAMECLHQIFIKGNKDSSTSSSPTCQRLQLLVHHYATCDRKLTPGGCTHCKRTRELFRLHSSLCTDHPCRVPLCKHFKLKIKRDEKLDQTWRLLVKKVATAKVMATLARRKRPELVQRSWLRYGGRRR